MKPLAMLFQDEQGRLFLCRDVERVNKGGAPRKLARDIALTLHFDYLIRLRGVKVTAALHGVATIFGLKKPDDVRTIANKTRPKIAVHGAQLRGYEGSADAAGPLFVGLFVACPDGSIVGPAVRWGDKLAALVRGVPAGADYYFDPFDGGA